jgi:hypothetical protein
MIQRLETTFDGSLTLPGGFSFCIQDIYIYAFSYVHRYEKQITVLRCLLGEALDV